MISLCWGFGSPRAASARRVHVVLGICPPVSCQLLPAGVVGVHGCFALGLFVVMDFLSGVDGSDFEPLANEAVGDVPPVAFI